MVIILITNQTIVTLYCVKVVVPILELLTKYTKAISYGIIEKSTKG